MDVADEDGSVTTFIISTAGTITATSTAAGCA